MPAFQFCHAPTSRNICQIVSTLAEVSALNSVCQVVCVLIAGHSGHLPYFVFGLLYFHGFDLRAVPLIARKQLVTALFEQTTAEGNPIQLNSHIEADATAVFEQACECLWKASCPKIVNRSIARAGRTPASRSNVPRQTRFDQHLC